MGAWEGVLEYPDQSLPLLQWLDVEGDPAVTVLAGGGCGLKERRTQLCLGIFFFWIVDV